MCAQKLLSILLHPHSFLHRHSWVDDNLNLSDCYYSCFLLYFLHYPVWYSPVQTRQSLLSAYNPLLHTMAPQILLHEHRIQNLWDYPGHVRNHIQSPLQSHPDSGMVHSLLMNRIICRVPLYRRLPGFDNLASLIQVHCLSEPSYHPHLLPAAGRFHSFSECQSWHALSYLPESQV